MPTHSHVEARVPTALVPAVQPVPSGTTAGSDGTQPLSDLARATTDESDPGQAFRRVFGWVALFAALFWGTFVGGFLAYHTLQPDGWMIRLIEHQFAAVILVPMSGLGALCIVLLLRLSSGPLEFKAIGFEFRGASGQVVLWVVSFIAMVAAVKLLWVAP